MTTHNFTYNKTNYQTNIKRWQGLYNRFKRRYHTSTNTTERRFLKTEATRVCNELRSWSKKWQTWGWGNYNWITKNFTMTHFTAGPTTCRRTTTWKSPTNRTSNYHKTTPRTYGSRTTYGRRGATRTNTRSFAARKNYLAW